MKRRSKIWLIFLVLGIVCTFVTKCKDAKAEGWSPEDWLPEWIQTEDPFDTPAPLPTPSPDPRLASEPPQANDPVDERGVPLNANRGTVGYKIGYFTRPANELSSTVTWTSATGGGTSTFELSPWGKTWSNFATLNGIVNFTSPFTLPSTNTGLSSVSSRRNGMSLEVRLSPSQAIDGSTPWTNEVSFHFTLNWSLGVNLMLGNNAEITLEQFNFSNDTIITEIPVTIFFGLNCSDGIYRWIQEDTTVAALYNFEKDISFDIIPDEVYCSYVDVSVVVNYLYRLNPLYYRVANFYASSEGSNIPQENRIYPSMVFSALNQARLSFTCRYTDDAKNRSWLSKLITKIFVPSSDEISAMVLAALGDPSEGGTGAIISMRENLYNLFNNSTDNDTTITLPSLNVSLNGTTYQFFNGYTFDLKSFYNMTITGSSSSRPIFSVLMEAVRTFNSVLIFSAFFSSVWAMVTRIFGLHLWQGVNGEDIDEHDNE